jgi:hypothetical protein
MAFPSGGHPTLAQYLEWAQEQGCEVKYGHAVDDEGRPYSVTRISAPKSVTRFVVVPDVKLSEELDPKMVAYLDRRLRIKSPFHSDES